MSGPEKRHFKLHARMQKRKKGAQYLLLFDLLAASASLEPEMVREGMGWKVFASNYSTAKKSLEEKVLASLEDYQTEKSETQAIQKLIRHIRVLRDRRMDDLAGKKVRKALKRARKIQNPVLALEILLEKRTLLLRDGQRVFRREDLAELTREIEDATNGIRLEQQVRDVHYQFYSLLALKGAYVREESASELEECLDRLGRLSFDNPYSFLPAYYNCLVKQQGCYVRGDVQGSCDMLLQVIDLFDRHPGMVREHGGKYLSSLHNLLGRLLLLNAHAEFSPFMERIRNFQPRFPRLLGQRLETYFGLGLAMLVNSGQFERNEAFLTQARSIVRGHQHLISRRMGIQIGFLIASCLFLEEKTTLALREVRRLLANETLQRIESLNRALRLMLLLLLFDSGEWDLLEYQLKSRREGLRGKEGFALEHGFLGALSRVLRQEEASTQHVFWEELLEKTVALADAPESSNLLSMFNFEAWIRAKRDGKIFVEAVQEEWQAKGGGDLVLLPLEDPTG